MGRKEQRIQLESSIKLKIVNIVICLEFKEAVVHLNRVELSIPL